MATVRTNMKKFKADVQKYGRRLDEEGIKRAAIDLSVRAANAVKRDFTVMFDQTPSKGPKTVRTGRLRASVVPVVKSQTSFGVGSNVVYARIHEVGGRTSPHIIRPKRAKALRFMSGGRVIFAKSVKHPGSLMRARHWMSKPMQTELTEYIKDQIKNLERPL